MNADEICARIDTLLVDEFELDADAVTPEARLREDLDLDSLDAVDLIVAMEKNFGVRIEDKAMAEMRTLGDLHAWIRAHLGQA